MADNLESGPLGWAQEIIQSGAFHTSVVQSLWAHLMGRELILDPTSPDAEIELLQQLASQFQADDDCKALVKRIVMTDQYRRVR